MDKARGTWEESSRVQGRGTSFDNGGLKMLGASKKSNWLL